MESKMAISAKDIATTVKSDLERSLIASLKRDMALIKGEHNKIISPSRSHGVYLSTFYLKPESADLFPLRPSESQLSRSQHPSLLVSLPLAVAQEWGWDLLEVPVARRFLRCAQHSRESPLRVIR